MAMDVVVVAVEVLVVAVEILVVAVEVLVVENKSAGDFFAYCFLSMGIECVLARIVMWGVMEYRAEVFR